MADAVVYMETSSSYILSGFPLHKDIFQKSFQNYHGTWKDIKLQLDKTDFPTINANTFKINGLTNQM